MASRRAKTIAEFLKSLGVYPKPGKGRDLTFCQKCHTHFWTDRKIKICPKCGGKRLFGLYGGGRHILREGSGR